MDLVQHVQYNTMYLHCQTCTGYWTLFRKSTKSTKYCTKYPIIGIQRKNLLHETFSSFVQDLKRFRRKKTKPWDFVRNLKKFRGEGSFALSRGRTFLGFVKFFYDFFRQFNSFGSFLTSTEPFCRVREKTFSLGCILLWIDMT